MTTKQRVSSDKKGFFGFCRKNLELVLLSLIIVVGLVATFSLRQNNLNMVKLRQELVAIDETGDVARVQQAAKKLQHYVANHMNTTMGRVALQTLYNQAAEQAMEQSRPADVNPNIYSQATNDCKPQLVNYGYQAWASCVAAKAGLNEEAARVTAEEVAPDPDLYYIDYISTRWSADLAGVSLLLLIILTGALLVLIVIRLYRKIINYCKLHNVKTSNRG